MDVFRRLERRLEGLLDGVIGGVFRGAIHPSELAGKIAREADLGSIRTDTGANLVPNHFELSIHPGDVGGQDPPATLAAELARTLEELAMDRGWRMDGPATVTITLDESASHGNPRCHGTVRPGTRPAWAALSGATEIPVRVNHAVVGRGTDVDVPIPEGRVSRRHARLWREAGGYFVADLGSSNGTSVDGTPVQAKAVEVTPPAMITFADQTFRFEAR